MTDDPLGSTPLGEPGPSPKSLGRHELQDRAVRGAAWTLINTLIGVPVAFLVNIVIARVLGVVDYGRLAFLTTVMEVVGGIIGLGVGTGLIQFASKSHAAGRRTEVANLLSITQGFRLVSVAPIVTLVVLGIARIDLWLLIVALAFGVWVPAAIGGGPACFAIENRTDRGAQNAIVVNLLTQGAVIAIVLTLGTADSIWAARLMMGGLGVMSALFMISPDYRRAILRPRLPRRFPPGFWAFALPAGLASVVGTLVVSRTEVVILTWLTENVGAGIFALAFGLASHLFGPANSLIGPLVPAISGLREVDEDAVARAFTRTVRASSTVVGLIVATALPALAFLVIPIYGTQFADAPPVLMALGAGAAILAIAGPVQAFVQARLQGRRILAVNLVALIVNLTLAFGLIPPLGVWGAVIANLSAAATRLVFLIISETNGLELTRRVVAASIAPLVLGILVGGASWAITTAVPAGWVGQAALAASIGMLSWLAALRLSGTGLAPNDADAILRVMPVPLRSFTHAVLALATRSRLQ